MPSANKDRIRVTFHLDKKLYRLLKKCSQIEDMPMSRIIDEMLESRVGKYAFRSYEDWAATLENEGLEETVFHPFMILQDDLETLKRKVDRGEITEDIATKRAVKLKADFEKWDSERKEKEQIAAEEEKRKIDFIRSRWKKVSEETPPDEW